MKKDLTIFRKSLFCNFIPVGNIAHHIPIQNLLKSFCIRLRMFSFYGVFLVFLYNLSLVRGAICCKNRAKTV